MKPPARGHRCTRARVLAGSAALALCVLGLVAPSAAADKCDRVVGVFDITMHFDDPAINFGPAPARFRGRRQVVFAPADGETLRGSRRIRLPVYLVGVGVEMDADVTWSLKPGQPSGTR